MMDKLAELDRELFIALNGLHREWLDQAMYFLTQTAAWAPLYLIFLYLIFRVHGRNAWVFLIGIAITVALADQITSTLMKPYFQRLRPSHEPSLTGLVHGVNNYVGGKFGFASSHAANTIGVATFIFLLLRHRFRWIAWIFLWAIFVSYTRIYLGVHYPGDIIVGGLIGSIIAWISYRVSSNMFLKLDRRSDDRSRPA
jgi:undecaprenyl-diphosphatase